MGGNIMMAVATCLISSLVVITSADVCYYNDGSINGHITLCPLACCGTGKDPCCPESNDVLPYIVGVIVSSSMLMVCFLVCCVYKVRTRARVDIQEQTREIARQQRLSELKQASTEYHIVVFSGQKSRKLEFPPRYSEIYPEKDDLYLNKSNDGVNKSRSGSTKSNSSLATSIKRSSLLRNALRRGQVTESLSSYQISEEGEDLNSNTTDRSSLMHSIVSSFPTFFKKENT